MPQVDFYFSDRDIIDFAVQVFDAGAWLVPDLRFEEQSYCIIRDTDTFVRTRKATRLFFILHDSYFACPLEMRPLARTGQSPHYYIMQRNGGPTIDFFSPGIVNNKENRSIGQGFLAHHPSYYNTRTRTNLKTPPTLLAVYKDLCSGIKSSTSPLRAGKRTFLLGKEAHGLRSQGVPLVGLGGANSP